ncbi:fimbrial protein [Salmonella enterica]|uniref:Fimbrial protein n=1 Tax=Salmonella enterica TaxID=28901 RepID=A0A5U7RSS7_SALER|nr:fimbrial protein [Salmonella enterica]
MIKSGNGTMKTRDDRPSFALSCRLNLPALLRWLLMMFVLAGPGYVYAADVNYGCTIPGGGNSVTLNLPSSVSFSPSQSLHVGDVVYRSDTYQINYDCWSGNGGYVFLQRLGDMNVLTQALKETGLEMQFEISNTAENIFIPDYNPLDSSDQVKVSQFYNSKNTGKLSLQIVLKVSRVVGPVFAAVPALSSFRLAAVSGGFDGSRIEINSTPVRIQYVPECFVRTSLNTNNINFGSVLTTEVDNSFTRSIPFTVTADVNSSCYHGNLMDGYTARPSGGPQTFYLNLPLKVSFVLNNGGVVSSDKKSIQLYKEGTSDKNGLQLEIKPHEGEPVTFNEASLPVNKFGNFYGAGGGGKWVINNDYNAVLSSTAGEQVKTGKYSAQVTVKVDYY